MGPKRVARAHHLSGRELKSDDFFICLSLHSPVSHRLVPTPVVRSTDASHCLSPYSQIEFCARADSARRH